MIDLADTARQSLTPMTDPLAIYLNDHLGGATAGLELFRRAAAGVPLRHRESLRRMAADVERDRASLIEFMGTLEIPVRHYKVAAGWMGEKLGRFKPNGRLVGRSSLSSMLEIEALVLGVRGKAAGWQALRIVADHDSRLPVERLDELIAVAGRQSEELEQIRRDIARETFTPG